MLWEFKNKKTQQKQLRKFAEFMPKVLLLTTKFETGFQSFILVICLRDEPRQEHSSDIDQGNSRELVECNPCKSSQELTLDFCTSRSTICCHLKKIGKVSMKNFLENTLHYSIGKILCFAMIKQDHI